MYREQREEHREESNYRRRAPRYARDQRALTMIIRLSSCKLFSYVTHKRDHREGNLEVVSGFYRKSG